ncbi:MAG: biotin--[acetyl-CoA-carboxylase] ligase [Thermodesulfobacteriota bacterium]
MTDLLTPQAWQARLATRFLGRGPVTALTETGSTNADALAAAAAGAPAGALFLADRQTAGRGRLGHSWHSPPGAGLYASLILRPQLAAADLPKLTLAAGLAVCRALARAAGLAPGLKWPNDLLLAGRKCGGILAETGPSPGGPVVVLGLGLNSKEPPGGLPAALAARATWLSAHTSAPLERGVILAAILLELEGVLAELEAGGFARILAAWRQRDALAGQWLEVVAVDGRVVAGWSLGPDDQGVLQVQEASGRRHAVLSGDLRLGRRPRLP